MTTVALIRTLAAERDFVRLMSAQWLAQLADGVAQAAFANQLVLEPLAQGTPERILAVFALTLLPYSLIAPFTGVLVDRWARRSLLVSTNAARALLLVTLPLWARALPGEVPLYASLLLLLGLGRLFLTTKGAVLPVVLHEHHLLRGNSISGAGGMIAALTGGVLGIAAAAVTTTETAFVAAGLVYALAVMGAARMSRPMRHALNGDEPFGEAIARVARALVEGLRAIWVRPGARLPLFGIFVLRVSAMFVAIAAILVIKQDFPLRADEVGRLSSSALALFAAGVGAFLGAVSTPLIGRRFNKPQLLLVGFVFSGAAMLLTGMILTLPAVIVLTLVGGYGTFVAKIAVDAQVQEALPDAYRGRAFALYDILYNLASVVAALVMVVFAATSLRVMLIVMALLTLALAGALGSALQGAGLLAKLPSD